MSASFLPRHDTGEGETFGISEGMCRRQRPEVLKQQENVNAANRLASSKIFTLIPFKGLDASGIGPEGTSVTLRSKLKLHLQLISCDSLEYACVISC